MISRSGWTGTVKDLYGDDVIVHSEDEIESFRWGGGLFGVNCRHYPMNFIPGFSTLKGEPQDPEENEQAYAESQQQRALERKLREERRDLAVLKAQGAGEDEIRAQRERVNRASANIDDFCDEHGLPRRRSREYTPVNATFPPEDSYNQKVFPREKKEQMGEFFGLNSPGERGIIEGRKARVFNADGTEAYRYPKSDIIQKMTSSEEINEYFSKTDWNDEKHYLFSGAFQDMPLDHQKALAESVLYMQETFKPKEWPSTIRVQKTATVDGLKVAGYYDPGLRKIVVSTEGNKSEGELYKTVIHELIHHYDRYGDEAEYCVKKAVSGLMERVNPETGLLYSTSEVDFLKADLAGVYATDDAELLAYSIEQNLSIRASHNPLGQEISRLFEERNARQ